MDPVKKAQSAKIDSRLLMVQVMFLREHCEEVIPAMRNHRLYCSRSPEQKACKNMTTQDLWR